MLRRSPPLESIPSPATHRRDPTGTRVGGLQPARREADPAEADPAENDPAENDPAESDQALAAALVSAQQGDEQGFAELWRSLHPRLLRYLLSREDVAAEDVAAETWLQVIRDLPGFTGGLPEFRAWLFTVARNRAIDQGRSRAARPAIAMPDPGVVAPARTAPSAEESAGHRAATEAALRLVATLPPEQAEMVMLRVVAGLDVAAVAELVGKTPGAVRVAVHRALKSLSHTFTDNPENRSDRESIRQRGGVT